MDYVDIRGNMERLSEKKVYFISSLAWLDTSKMDPLLLVSYSFYKFILCTHAAKSFIIDQTLLSMRPAAVHYRLLLAVHAVSLSSRGEITFLFCFSFIQVSSHAPSKIFTLLQDYSCTSWKQGHSCMLAMSNPLSPSYLVLHYCAQDIQVRGPYSV